KTRPALIVQADHVSARLRETIIAIITSKTSTTHEPTRLSIDIATSDGAASGLLHDSTVRCERLHCIPQSDIKRVIGHLSVNLLKQVDDVSKLRWELCDKPIGHVQR